MAVSGIDATKPLLVIPSTMRIFGEIAKGEVAGKISVSYPDQTIDSDEDYDEDTQLYRSMAAKAAAVPPILVINHQDYMLITVPPLQNPIEYNVIATAITSTTTNIIMVAPAPITWVASLGNEVAGIPAMEPPATVTGIVAAIALRLLLPTIVAVSGEGQPGFERINPDSVVHAGYVVGQLLNQGEDYGKGLARAIQKVTDTMYV